MNKKRFNVYSVQEQMEKYNISEKEAIDKINEIKKKISNPVWTIEFQMKKHNITKKEAEDRIEHFKEKSRLSNSKQTYLEKRIRNCKTKEHWINKGYSEEESIKMANFQVEYMQKKFQEYRKETPNKYNDIIPTQIGYWLKKGYSENDAKEKLKERQQTFTLDKCIEKYGEVDGTIIYNNRQLNWVNKLQSKSTEEKKIINSKKSNSLSNFILRYGEIEGIKKYNDKNFKNSKKYRIKNDGILKYNKKVKQWIENLSNAIYNNRSKISISFFNLLINNFNLDVNDIIFEYKINNYYYDFKYKNKIIEFNGDFWHCNPMFYNENDVIILPTTNKKILVSDIWKKDEIKKSVAEYNKFEVLYIWEYDYKKNIKNVLNDVKTFLFDKDIVKC